MVNEGSLHPIVLDKTFANIGEKSETPLILPFVFAKRTLGTDIGKGLFAGCVSGLISWERGVLFRWATRPQTTYGTLHFTPNLTQFAVARCRSTVRDSRFSLRETQRPSAHGRAPTAPWALAHRPMGARPPPRGRENASTASLTNTSPALLSALTPHKSQNSNLKLLSHGDFLA